MESINSYIARSIIRYLNGDIEKFRRLRNMALMIYEEEEYQRHCICSIGDLTPELIKRKLYRITRGNRAC